jgi:tetratricopeptide (TPR) repeat protein
MRAVEVAGRVPALRVPVAIETAQIHQAQGNLDRARSEYEALVHSGHADGRVLFQLALLSIQSGRVQESESFLRRAAETGLALDESEYFDLGQAYAAAGSGFEEQAIDMLKRSMGPRQNSEAAWTAIAEVNRRRGERVLEAEAYVNMFKLNPVHSQRLKLAGEIFEQLGMTDKAKDAYSLFLDRRFSDNDVSLNLARIIFNEGQTRAQCNRIGDILRGIEGITLIPEAMQMLDKCDIRIRNIDATRTAQTKKLSPLMLTLRISGAVVAAGGLTTGLIINSVTIPDLDKRYHDFGTPDNPSRTPAEDFDEVKKLRDSIDSMMFLRSAMYVLAGVGLSGFAVTFFF